MLDTCTKVLFPKSFYYVFDALSTKLDVEIVGTVTTVMKYRNLKTGKRQWTLGN